MGVALSAAGFPHSAYGVGVVYVLHWRLKARGASRNFLSGTPNYLPDRIRYVTAD